LRQITIHGARLHNLKNVDVTIPKDALVVITGVSGSGKSTLAFDILFEEGRKQYLRSIGMLGDVASQDAFDRIAGLGPTVAVGQAIVRQSNPRSVVGTRTQILTYLGLLYARDGRMPCPVCGATVGGTAGMRCASCGHVTPPLQANTFSFNSPSGMCLHCEGRGTDYQLHVDRLVPDEQITLRGVLEGVDAASSFGYMLRGRLKRYADVPFTEMPDEARTLILYGVETRGISRHHSHNLYRVLKRRLQSGEDVGGVMTADVCPACHGYRVGEEARRVTLRGQHIGQLGQMPVVELHAFLQALSEQGALSPFGHNLVRDVLGRTEHLIRVGLGYLALYRPVPTLSGGEGQRLFLSSHLDAAIDSLIYVLDEPTVGLHELEKAALLEQLAALRAAGNTVIVVEHDPNTVACADHVIDIGPLAGADGGEVVYQGPYAGLLACQGSITGQYLSGRRTIPAPRAHAQVTANTPCLTLHRARTHNLKDLTVSFPLGVLVGVAGVSGSGKSSLVIDTLVPLLERRYATLHQEGKDADADAEEDVDVGLPGPAAERLDGTEHLSGYAQVSQAPIGRQYTSTPASYVGMWGAIRRLYARQPLAVERGYTAGHFSFNALGACPECKGRGSIRFWLGDRFFVSNTCPVCDGKRYQDEILEVTYRDKNILDVLDMSVSEAATFLVDLSSAQAMLRVLERTGMGYIALGQPAPTLSGGEAQRIKLAKEIGRRRQGEILYVLDEPTTGLSPYDVARLLALLDELVAQGSSVIVVEHDPATLSHCDWLIELGPGAGSEGGELIAQGPPASLAADPRSRTGPFLQVHP
ncbi:MAG: ABC-ATPase UvrA, partial [Anaerolineae bacterium]